MRNNVLERLRDENRRLRNCGNCKHRLVKARGDIMELDVERAKSKPIDVMDEIALLQEMAKIKFRNEIEKRKNCGNCIYYLTKDRNEDKCTEYHHDRTKDRGICALYDQLRGIPKTECPCRKWRYDNEQ